MPTETLEQVKEDLKVARREVKRLRRKLEDYAIGADGLISDKSGKIDQDDVFKLLVRLSREAPPWTP